MGSTGGAYLEEGLGELESGVGHGEGGRASTLLGLDDLITTKLDALDKGISGLVVLWGEGWGGQAQEWDDGLARVAADDGDGDGGGVGLSGDGGDKGGGTDDIEGGDAKELLGVKDVVLLENLGGDWDGGVDGVGDDEDEGLGGELGDAGDQVTDDTGVDLEEIITGHSWLACWREYPLANLVLFRLSFFRLSVEIVEMSDV